MKDVKTLSKEEAVQMADDLLGILNAFGAGYRDAVIGIGEENFQMIISASMLQVIRMREPDFSGPRGFHRFMDGRNEWTLKCEEWPMSDAGFLQENSGGYHAHSCEELLNACEQAGGIDGVVAAIIIKGHRYLQSCLFEAGLRYFENSRNTRKEVS